MRKLSLLTLILITCTCCTTYKMKQREKLYLSFDNMLNSFLTFSQQADIYEDAKKIVEGSSEFELMLLCGDKPEDKDVIYFFYAKDKKTGLVSFEILNDYWFMSFEGIENDFDKIRKLTSDCMKVYIQNIDQKKLIESTSKSKLKEAK